MADTIQVEILEDGTLKITTDKVSMPNHAGAEALLRELAKDMGGDMSRIKKAGAVHHEHDGHFHSHGG